MVWDASQNGQSHVLMVIGGEIVEKIVTVRFRGN
jgi:hypothetical protein